MLLEKMFDFNIDSAIDTCGANCSHLTINSTVEMVDNQCKMEVKLPGISKEDLKLQLTKDGNYYDLALSIKDKTYHFDLPNENWDLDQPEKVNVSYKDGLLTILLPLHQVMKYDIEIK